MSLKDSNAKKNYTNVAPLPTKKGKIHYRKLKIKQTLEPIKKVVKSVVDWVKEDIKTARPVRIYQPRKKEKKDWENIH